MNVVFRAAAEAEVEEAFAYYDDIDPELADDFLLCVDEAIGRMTEHPDAYALVHRDLRRVRLVRFPHLLVFRRIEDTLIVVACTHPRQNPIRWRRRT